MTPFFSILKAQISKPASSSFSGSPVSIIGVIMTSQMVSLEIFICNPMERNYIYHHNRLSNSALLSGPPLPQGCHFHANMQTLRYIKRALAKAYGEIYIVVNK